MSTDKLLTFSARRPWLAVLIIVAISLVMATGLPNLRVNTSYDSLISEEDPGKADYDRTVEDFGSDNITIIYIRDADLWAPEKLAVLEEFVYQVQDLPFVTRVDSMFSAQSIRDQEGFLDSRVLMDIAPADREEAAAVKGDALYSPLIKGNLLSEDGTVTAVNVTVLRQPENLRFNAEVHAQIEERLVPLREVFADVRQVGQPRLNVEIENGMFADLSILTPISTLVLIAAIIILIRLPLAAGIPMVTAGTSILWTLGFMGHAGIDLTLLTGIVPSLIIVIGSTEDMHLVAMYLSGLARGNGAQVSRQEAVRAMAKHVGIAILLTGFTTAIGFFSNAVSDIPLIRDFAYASSFGMVANLWATILWVPLLLSILGPTSNPVANKDQDAHHKGIIGVIMPLVERITEHHERKLVVIIAGLVAVFGYLATTVHVSNDPLSYFPDDHPLVADAGVLHRDLAGMQVFYVTIDAKKDDAFKRPEVLADLERAVNYIEERGVFDNTMALTKHLKLVNREMHGADHNFFKLPENADLVSQYLILFERKELERYVTADYSRANIVVRHNISDSHALNGYLAELAFFLDTLGYEYRLTGQNLMINRAAEGLFGSQLTSLAMVGAIIFLIISILYTSMFAGIMFLIPNLFPVVMNFGMMALLGIPLNPGTAAVAAIAIGIAVDDSIHLFTGYRIARSETGENEAAVRKTLRTEALAMISTSLALSVMFFTLLTSNFAIVAQFGLLAGLTMIYALIADLLITPLILRRVGLVSVFDLATLKVGAEVLMKSPLFVGMSPYQVKKTILLSKVESYPKGSNLIVEGEAGQNMYMVLDGRVEVMRGGASLAVLGPGEVFGEIGFVGEAQRLATVQAKDDVEVLSLAASAVDKGMRFHPILASRLNLNIARIIGRRLAGVEPRAMESAG